MKLSIVSKVNRWVLRQRTKWAVWRSGGIPRDLEHAFACLDRLWGQTNVEDFKSIEEDRAMAMTHFGPGMWLRNNWGLWRGSRLAKWFNGLGIHHADDMSAIILRSFHRRLHGAPIKLEEQIAYYREHWIKQGIDPDTLKKA